MSPSEPWRDVARPCPLRCQDEHGLHGVAEPEQDGEHRYHECTNCGYAFGWARVDVLSVQVKSEGSCAVGVPEDLRRRASAAMNAALAADAEPLFTIGRRPDDTAS